MIMGINNELFIDLAWDRSYSIIVDCDVRKESAMFFTMSLLEDDALLDGGS